MQVNPVISGGLFAGAQQIVPDGGQTGPTMAKLRITVSLCHSCNIRPTEDRLVRRTCGAYGAAAALPPIHFSLVTYPGKQQDRELLGMGAELQLSKPFVCVRQTPPFAR